MIDQNRTAMFLPLEAGIARSLARRSPGSNPLINPASPQRHGLVLVAAHAVFPEADIDSLPEIAREELAFGLDGPIRTSLAAYPYPISEAAEPDFPVFEYPDIAGLSKKLLHSVGGDGQSVDVALLVAARVHLARSVRGTVPIIVATSCLTWYSHYVSPTSPHAALFADANRLVDIWTNEYEERTPIESEMMQLGRTVVGYQPPDYLDMSV